MKKTILILACGMSFLTGFSQELPKWANKAKKAVFSVITYNKDNQILNTGNGFYIDEQGTAVSDYSLFKGADHAVIVTADGKELPVKYIMGANDIYDVVKFKTEFDKKAAALQAATPGETVYLLPYSTQKSANGQNGTIAKIDTIGNNSFYYTLNMQTTDKTVSCPIMDGNGEVLGLIQKNSDPESKESYAIGVTYASSLALVYLYMAASTLDRDSYLGLLNDFISQYPENQEGYLRRATCYINFGDDSHNALAEEDLKKMLDIAKQKDDAHYNIAKLIYSYQLNKGDKPTYADWTFERALNEINTAIQITQQPIYYQVQGDTFYSSAKAKDLMEGVDKKEVVALMDSAVARFNKPYGKDAAPYLYERAGAKTAVKDFRGAVADYNDFYDAMMGQVSAEFYLIRTQAEMQCRMFQQAINDINKAIELDPQNVNYWVEKGGVCLRVNQTAEAVQALEKAISIDSQNAPAYRMLGYIQVQQEQTEKGIANLKKAKELGDEVAIGLLEKYSK